MKPLFFLLVFAFTLINTAQRLDAQIIEPPRRISPPASIHPEKWIYVWGDEFNGTSVDTSRWELISTPTMETHQEARRLFAQSTLTLAFPKIDSDITRSFTLKSKKNILYGRVEIHASLPISDSTTTYFFTDGINRDKVFWPTCGEIMINQFHGGTKSRENNAGVQYEDAAGEYQNTQSITLAHPPKPTTNIVYAMEWDDENIKVFINNQLVSFFKVRQANFGNYNPFRLPHHINIKLTSMHGQPTHGLNISAVRYYQKACP